MTLPPTLHGFADQSLVEHGLTVVGGVLVCAGVYFVSLDLLMGGIEVAVSEAHEATALRRQSATIAGIVCFTYFSIAFIFARGGPLLSFAFYPVFIVVYSVPYSTRLLLGSAPDDLYTHGSFFLSPLFVRDTVTMVVPGIVTAFLIVGLWMLLTDNDELRKWADTNLTEGFKEEFIEEARRELERKRSEGKRPG
ncbi:hypothetical protein [Halalkalicoccus salilacus]|uniref:hypothetical protein n=1 Tax=Halalkalicoccus TaxID=332246 RepID=UPI002F963A9E